MRVINATAELLNGPDRCTMYTAIEAAGRTCYKSTSEFTEESGDKFIRKVIASGHEAVIEHAAITIKFTCDRGVSHEIVRHRLAAYCQESTRYCNYSKDKFGNELTFIKPLFFDEETPRYDVWCAAMRYAENSYFELLQMGATPQEARSVLPNSLKTEVVMTANPREWRHFFKLRCAKAAHPQMREVAQMAYKILCERYPALFEDITWEAD